MIFCHLTSVRSSTHLHLTIKLIALYGQSSDILLLAGVSHGLDALKLEEEVSFHLFNRSCLETNEGFSNV